MNNTSHAPQWKMDIDTIHRKHLNNIQTDGVNDLAFHYTSPTGLLGILSSKKIWFSDCDYLNDASESNYFLELSSKIFSVSSSSRIENNLSFRSYLLASFHSNDNNNSRMTFSREEERRYVFSLSLRDDNLSLWNNYTKTMDLTGYSVGFNINRLTDSIQLSCNQNLLFGRVIYSREYQKELLNELLCDYLDLYKKYSNSYQRKYLYESLENNILVYSVFMKDGAFKCEDEFRIAIFEKGNASCELAFREKSGAFVPYISKSIDGNSIASIMISPTARADFVNRSVANLSKHYELESLEIHNSQIPLRY